MRQVPKNSILLVGDGKMARHWAHFLQLNSFEFDSWSRSQAGGDGRLQNLGHYQCIFVAISDDALDSFYQNFLDDFPGESYHFSGSFYRKGFFGLHPLMTFSGNIYDPRVYKNLTFTMDHDQPLGFLESIPNRSVFIAPEAKQLYHALCVMASNFPQMLWKFCYDEFEKLGVDGEALIPMISQSLENFMEAPQSALTGPHSRGDLSTLSSNAKALARLPERQIYEAFTRVYATPRMEVHDVSL